MTAYFVDSWFLIALSNRFDNDYAIARRLRSRLTDALLITHDGVLSEVLTYFCDGGAFNRQGGIATVRRVLQAYAVEPMGRELFLRGLDLYSRRLDKEYSHVDCVSMVIMREHGITHVLTNDHHFRQEGFTLVNQ